MRFVLSLVLLAAPALFAADANMVRLLPADPRGVAGVSVSQSLNSPLGRYILSQLKDEDGGLKKLTEATGFDYRRDLHEVVVANYGAGTKDNALLVARGSFDVSRIRSAFIAMGGNTLSIEGVEMLQAKDGNAFAFVNGSTVVAGDAELVRTALTRQNAQVANRDLAARITEMSAKYDAWMFTATPVSTLMNMPETPATGNKKGAVVRSDVLRGVVSASGGLKFGNTVEISGEAVARSDKDATALHDVMKFFAGMITLNREEKGNEELAKLVETLQVGTKGNTVSFSLSVPELEVEKMIDQKNTGRSKAGKI